MVHLIDKDALVAEIEKQIELGKFKCLQSQENNDRESYVAWSEHIATCRNILSFLNTLEVKEVDLENSVKGRIDYPLIGYDFPNIYPNYKELKDYCDKNGIKDEDKLKIIIIKET
jgi:hypothetical protein